MLRVKDLKRKGFSISLLGDVQETEAGQELHEAVNVTHQIFVSVEVESPADEAPPADGATRSDVVILDAVAVDGAEESQNWPEAARTG